LVRDEGSRFRGNGESGEPGTGNGQELRTTKFEVRWYHVAMESFTAVFTEENGWVIGWVEEMPGAVAQEKTLEEARVSLRAALNDVLEANRELTREAAAGQKLLREPLTLGG
jgi:predicted RNase H-like HicB family nuclease